MDIPNGKISEEVARKLFSTGGWFVPQWPVQHDVIGRLKSCAKFASLNNGGSHRQDLHHEPTGREAFILVIYISDGTCEYIFRPQTRKGSQ